MRVLHLLFHRIRSTSLKVGVAMIVAAGYLLWFANQHYPLEHWLLFHYLRTWIFVAGFATSCLLSGWAILERLLSVPPRLAERSLLAFATGVLTHYLLMILAGFLGLYSPALFYAIPLVQAGIGLPVAVRHVPRITRRLSSLGVRLFMPKRPLHVIAALALVLGIVAVYLQVLLPKNVHADSHWYHFPIAEHYVAAGGIVRFEEGWYVGCYPQLATILYTWAFLSPGTLFSHVLLCAHLEFTLFIATVLGVSVLAARVLRRSHLAFSSATVFLFPGLFLYDSNVCANADHVLGFWALGLALALIRLGKNFSIEEAVLAGLFAGGAASTKYQASYMIVPALLLIAVLTLSKRRWAPGLVWLATVAAVSSTFWLRNLVYYHDPLYPLLNRLLPSTPFFPGASTLIERFYWPRQFAATGTALERLLAAVEASVNFSFVPHDWDFHGARPVFGSLFTLTIPTLLLLRGPRRRLWLLILGTYVGLIVWYLTSHQDRFLQALLPWMAAATAAVLARAWRGGMLARIGASMLVLAQVAAGLDVYFIREHGMIGDSPFRGLGEYLGAGYKGDYAERYEISSTYQRLGAELPEGATLLLHTWMGKLGIGAKIVADGVGWQGAIEYLEHDTPTATARLWRRFGLTHVLRRGEPQSFNREEAARELVFLRWLALYGGQDHKIDDATYARIMTNPRDQRLAETPTRIAWLSCDLTPPLGIYSPRGLERSSELRQLSESALLQHPLEELKEATALLLQHEDCSKFSSVRAAISEDFSRKLTAGKRSLWVRTKAVQ